jgi:hypothetical protein
MKNDTITVQKICFEYVLLDAGRLINIEIAKKCRVVKELTLWVRLKSFGCKYGRNCERFLKGKR